MALGRRNRRAGMIFILVTLFIDLLGLGIIVPVLPELIKEFAAGDDSQAGLHYGVVIALYALMQFLCAPVLGALSDRYGRRPIILGSLFGFGVDYLVQGFTPSIGWLFAGRAVAGVLGASVTTANAYIADVSTPDTRARNYGFVGVAFGLGFIFGPALGGLLGGIALRLPFFVAAGLALVNWLYGFFVLPESLPPARRSPVSRGRMNPFGNLKRLRAHPLVAGLAVVYVCLSLAQRGLENVWVLHAGYRYGWDAQANGLTLALVGVTAALVQGLLVRPAGAFFGERRAILFGVSISTMAFIGYGLASAGWVVLVVIVVGSLGGVAYPTIQGLVAGAVPASAQGQVQGALTSLVSLTAIFAPLIFTAGLFSHFTGEHAPLRLPGAPFLFGAALCAAALLLLARLFRRIPDSPAAPAPRPVTVDEAGAVAADRA